MTYNKECGKNSPL